MASLEAKCLVRATLVASQHEKGADKEGAMCRKSQMCVGCHGFLITLSWWLSHSLAPVFIPSMGGTFTELITSHLVPPVEGSIISINLHTIQSALIKHH